VRLMGFSTGALAYSDFRLGLRILKRHHVKAVELSALRENELDPLVSGLDSLDLSEFTYVSVHAPSKFAPERETEVIGSLKKIAARKFPIVIHPDAIQNFCEWQEFADLLLVENMDKRNPMGRTSADLADIFGRLPQAKLCFDLGHCRQVDPTMNEAHLILEEHGTRLGQLHVSEVNSRSTHDPISSAAARAFGEVAHLIPEDIPVVLESPVSDEEVESEIQRVRVALGAEGPESPHSRNGKRDSKHLQHTLS
jgi:hypothetical protein